MNGNIITIIAMRRQRHNTFFVTATVQMQEVHVYMSTERYSTCNVRCVVWLHVQYVTHDQCDLESKRY